MSERAPLGRPEATSHAAIEQAAFALFAERGFAQTTLDAIAREVGVSRRTLFRYYRSKNDIPWGQFDRTLDAFRTLLDGTPPELSLREAIGRAVIAYNDFPPDASPSHEGRMRLILQTPTLQAHSVLRYAEWRQVIADYAGKRMGRPPDALEPQLVAQVSLAVALTAYAQWLVSEESLTALLERGLTALDAFLR